MYRGGNVYLVYFQRMHGEFLVCTFQPDWLSLIQNWVENKQEPVVAMSSKAFDGKVVATKPVYHYPKVAVYKGSGDASKDTSYGLKN